MPEETQEPFLKVIELIDAGETEPDRHLSIQLDNAMRDTIRAARESGQTAKLACTPATPRK